MGADVGGESAAMAEDGGLEFRAEVMASGHALAAVHATGGVPADADVLSDGDALGVWTDGGDAADDFVAEDGGELRVAPFVVEYGEIGVAEAAGFNGDFNVFDAERAEIDGFENHRLFRAFGDPGFVGHGSEAWDGGIG
jgi:hypothetical protein